MRSGLRTAATAAFAAGWVAAAAAAADTWVVVEVTSAGRDPQKWQARSDPVRFECDAGRLRAPLAAFATIQRQGDTNLYLAVTAAGDRWLGRLASDKLLVRSAGLEETDKLSLTDPPLEHLTVRGRREDGTPAGSARLTARDGSAYLLDAGSVLLPVANLAGSWRLPLGSLSSLAFRGPTEEGRACLVRFASGRAEPFELRGSTSHFKMRDRFGNRLRLAYTDIELLQARLGMASAAATNQPVTEADLAEAPPPLKVFGWDGQTRPLTLPVVVPEIKGAAGRLPVPTAQIVELRRTADGVELTTVYGDKLGGRVRPREIEVPAHGVQPPHLLALAEQRRLRFPNEATAAPPDWPLWRLDTGDRFHARFADPDGIALVGKRGEDRLTVAGRLVRELRRGADEALILRLEGESPLVCRPTSGKAELLLLVNGQTCSVPWTRVLSVGAPPPEEPPASEPDHAGERTERRPAPERAGESGLPPPAADFAGAEAIAVRGSLGELSFRPQDLIEAARHPEARAWCVHTVFGEIFAGRRPPEPVRDRFKTSGKFRIKLPGEPREVPEGYRSWRLTSGDLFYAAMRHGTLSVEPEQGPGAPVAISLTDLLAVTRAGPRGFRFDTTAGAVTGRPKQRGLPVSLLYAGHTADIPFARLDAMHRGPLSGLPPPCKPIPAALPEQEGCLFVPGGKFLMGSTAALGQSDASPPHSVSLSGFHIDVCEVTVAQFATFAHDSGYNTEPERSQARQTWQTPGFAQAPDEPVVCVTWHDAARYCNWRSKEAGLDACYDFGRGGNVVTRRERNGYRLPTEAEWEYAARCAGLPRLYPWGNQESPSNTVLLANFKQSPAEPSDGWPFTSPVKAFPPNALGLYGMAGNVWEWCEDWYLPRAYSDEHRRQPHNPCVTYLHAAGLTKRVMRGGSHDNRIEWLRATGRAGGKPWASADRVGFRCVRNASSSVHRR